MSLLRNQPQVAAASPLQERPADLYPVPVPADRVAAVLLVDGDIGDFGIAFLMNVYLVLFQPHRATHGFDAYFASAGAFARWRRFAFFVSAIWMATFMASIILDGSAMFLPAISKAVP